MMVKDEEACTLVEYISPLGSTTPTYHTVVYVVWSTSPILFFFLHIINLPSLAPPPPLFLLSHCARLTLFPIIIGDQHSRSHRLSPSLLTACWSNPPPPLPRLAPLSAHVKPVLVGHTQRVGDPTQPYSYLPYPIHTNQLIFHTLENKPLKR